MTEGRDGVSLTSVLYAAWFWPLLVVLIFTVGLGLWAMSSERMLSLFTRSDVTWAAMQANGVWRVGLDPSFPPFEMLDEAGNPVGYDVDLAQEIAALWGMDVEIVALGFDSLLDAAAAGKIDSVVSAMPYDPRATQDYAYSSPYFEAGIRLVVRNDSDIVAVEELENAKVAVEWGSMGDMVGRRLQREGVNIELAPYGTPEEAVSALIDSSGADALLVDNVSLRQAQGTGAAIKAIGPVLESNPYVIVMPVGASTLQEQVETALTSLRETGVMRELENRWFGAKPVEYN